MNEFELIERLKKQLPTNERVKVGVGDDCAVLDLGIPDHYLLFKTDAVVEGVHFLAETDPERVGHKALARCLSDVAAMGGDATAALVTLALPLGFDVAWVEKLYAGMGRLARQYNVSIAGGETTTNPAGRLISIALVGTVPKKAYVQRSGAAAGDAIFVTGELGGALRGKHLEFQPRLEEARWLASKFSIHAMIDLSDGLAGDLRHILRASKVGAELLSDAIPISKAARLQAREESSSKPPLLAALSDGEDFELLFTLPARQAVPVLDAWKKEFTDLRLTCIGKIIQGSSIKLRDKQGVKELKVSGYTHFDKPGGSS